jgi:peptide/nickel transport system permease protein
MKRLLIYLLKRILLYALIFFLSLTTFFFVLYLGPGDPVLRYVEQMQSRFGAAAAGINENTVAAFRLQFGLDQPIGTRYLAFIEQLLLHGNFGPSMVAYPTPARDLVLSALPWTVGLLSVAVIISWVLGVAAGTVLGWKRGKPLDSAATPFALILSQVPVYLMALLLALAFVYGLSVFPSGGAYAAMVPKALTLPFIGSVIYHALLPALSLILVDTCLWALSQRALVINLLGEDYMRLAEAKGLPGWTLTNRYILRNTMLPQTTGLALRLGFVVNGFFLIEWIFRYPGIGRLFVNSISALDYNVLLGITVTSMLVVLLANLIIEFLYPLVDPRIRRG